MKPDDFIKDYECALASQRWEAVAPLIHDAAAVTFSDGSVYKGKPEVKRAFERNFALIADEKYAIHNVTWVRKMHDVAVFLYGFAWEGVVNGMQARGVGIGTSVLINDGGRWKLLVEHLSARAATPVTDTE